ncbi:GxxExxY protein [Geothermobacter hydrogeniphilus]|uniref:GxxExxY protein n=1 Tax=Geothermobacter hydrogeniphilus TaxID=1969733 RepID=A0A1X0YAA8_9BACT|nr:GxxExxY protein [Geothermobacter hydrogeniphilus]ORJ62056.1 GxxExxY protein [Geothermobacter hydrogeniphilus]
MDGRKSQEDLIAKAVVDAAFKVHRRLGPGLLERVYEACLAYELESAGFRVERQVPVPIVYGELSFDEGFRLDLLIEDTIVIELKAAEKSHPLWQAQLISYLKLTRKRIGFLINFHSPLFKQGIQRFAV